MAARKLDGPQPFVVRRVRFLNRFGSVEIDAGVLGRDRKVEAVTGNGELVRVHLIGKRLFGIRRRHKRCIKIADLGVGHEVTTEIQRHAAIRDRKDNHQTSRDDPEYLPDALLGAGNARRGDLHAGRRVPLMAGLRKLRVGLPVLLAMHLLWDEAARLFAVVEVDGRDIAWSDVTPARNFIVLIVAHDALAE